jgi:hypothetical protein
MDALNRTAVDGFLDLLLRSPRGVVNLGEIPVVQAKDFGTDFGAQPARDALVLIHHGYFRHNPSPHSELKARNSITGTI